MASSRGNPDLGDILRSVAVLGAIVLIVYGIGRAFFTETPDTPTRAVEYTGAAESARRVADFDVLAPSRLPSGWQANSVRFERGNGGRWHLGVLTDDEEYVGIEQSTLGEKAAVDRWAKGSRAISSAPVADRVWQVRTGPQDRLTYVTRDGGATTLISSTADQDVVERYIESLSAGSSSS